MLIFIFETFIKIFTSLDYIHYVAALGNHEGFPVNMFPPSDHHGTNVSVEWLYDNVADLAWAETLDTGARDMFRQNGFYTTLIQPGLRCRNISFAIQTPCIMAKGI